MSQLISNAATATFELPTSTNAHISTFVGGGGNIPDGIGSFQDDIIVTDNFRITDVTVTLNNLIHTWVGDLSVRLRPLGNRSCGRFVPAPRSAQILFKRL